MRRLAASLALVAALPLAAGCFTVTHRYTGPMPLTNAPGLERPSRVVRHFEAHDRQFFWLHGGFPVGEPLNALALAAEEAESHDGVVNLHVRDGQNWLDILITHGPCVLSMLCGTWSAWAEGDVVDYTRAAPATSPARN